MSFSSITTYSIKSFNSYPAVLPITVPHEIELLDLDPSNPVSPSIVPLVSSAPSTTVSLEPAKTKAIGPLSNTSHQKEKEAMNGGRWTEQEHQSFLAGLQLYGREWKKVAAKIKTRTSAQIRSHAQKYFAKLARDDEMLKHSDLSMAISRSVGNFSEGSFSVPQSENDDVNSSFLSRPMDIPHSANHAKGSAAVIVGAMSSTVDGLSRQAGNNTNKRPRTTAAGFEEICSASSTRQLKNKRIYDIARAEELPSQEELLAKTPPNLRHKLSNLIEAEVCALQVLSCYIMVQQQGQILATLKEAKNQGKAMKLAPETNTATGRRSDPQSYKRSKSDQLYLSIE